MIKLCIFDLDGTLIDSIPAISHFGNTALQKCGFSPIDPSYYNYFLGDGRNVLIHRILAHHSADTDENYKKLGDFYDNEYLNNPNTNLKAYAGIIELLQEIKKMGIKIAVCSNKPDYFAKINVNHLFPDTFDYITGQIDGIPNKPEPNAALLICKNFGITPFETLFIGDTNIDIKTAKNGNFKSVGVLWGFRTKEELERAGADFIVNSPKEIAEILKTENEKNGVF